MIKLFVSLLLAFPRICEYMFKIVEAYEKEAYSRSRERNLDLIDEWLQDDRPTSEQDSHFISKLKVHSFTEPQRETIAEILRYVNDLEHTRQ